MFLRLISRPLMAKVKGKTGIVGLDVVPNRWEVLIDLYSKTLKEIQALPKDDGYRENMKSLTRLRLKMLQGEGVWEWVRKPLGCGEVERLIEVAHDEPTCVGKMIEPDPDGVPDDLLCELIEDDASNSQACSSTPTWSSS